MCRPPRRSRPTNGIEEPEIAIDDRAAAPPESTSADPVIGESRWPMAIAVLVLMGFALIAPPRLSVMPGWLLAALEGVLLLALILGDPGRIDRSGPWERRTSVALVATILVSTLGSTALLIFDLVTGSTVTNQADQLLLAGAKVWLGNNVAFAFLYWTFDGGGPAVRAHGLPQYPDFAFPQQLSPQLASSGWRPQFIDYLYVGFTTANAFSPTDTMPMVHWAKVAMGSQALISFVVVGLILARAVNAFT
jgi:uncharacterized membrane protein